MLILDEIRSKNHDIKSLVENPRTPHLIQNSELKQYMVLTAKQIKLKSDIIIIDYEDQYCIVVFDSKQNIYRLKLLPPEFNKILDKANNLYCTCDAEICNCHIQIDSVHGDELKSHYENDKGEIIMTEFNNTISRDGYKINSNGNTIYTINVYHW